MSGPGGPWPSGRASWGGQKQAELARELTRQRRGDHRTWLALARVLDGPEALEERLAALDRATELDPREIEPHDLKAELLAGSARFAEAEAACLLPWWGERQPVALQGRAAWILARRGDLAGAMARMRPVLADNPNYAWGWARLAEWAREAGTHEEYLEAAETSARINTEVAVAHGYRGEARLRNGNRAGAKESFRRALRSRPPMASPHSISLTSSWLTRSLTPPGSLSRPSRPAKETATPTSSRAKSNGTLPAPTALRQLKRCAGSA